ncbi:MAG: hypothetical protein Q8P84_05010, partial [Deltaproteobacteria bacterium]|nr:hypothetical protein [Deltaproteobacteria bacterium]
HVGGAIGFAAIFIGSYHIQEFVRDPVGAIYPFAHEKVTPDQNNNGVADIFEKIGANLKQLWTQEPKK